MGQDTNPADPADTRRSGSADEEGGRPGSNTVFALNSPLAWACAAVFAMIAAWLGMKLWTSQHELNALRIASELERANSLALKNDLEAERVVSTHLTQDLRDLEERLKQRGAGPDNARDADGFSNVRGGEAGRSLPQSGQAQKSTVADSLNERGSPHMPEAVAPERK
ncbi:MAG: hypothetical protein HS122_15825 [Opitutaceae bacterium]|nr:hypothetical protein [Opitutaceae bacterium]